MCVNLLNSRSIICHCCLATVDNYLAVDNLVTAVFQSMGTSDLPDKYMDDTQGRQVQNCGYIMQITM